MQRSRLKNIINKSKTISNKQEVGNPFDKFKKSLPIEVDDNYRLEAAWKAYGSPKDYKTALWYGMIQPIDENNYKLPSIGYNEETDEYEYLNKGKDNETVAKDIRVWDNDVIPLVKELKLGGYVRLFNKEKDCWTYSKNIQERERSSEDKGEQIIEEFKQGGKTSKKKDWNSYYEFLETLPSNLQKGNDTDTLEGYRMKLLFDQSPNMWSFEDGINQKIFTLEDDGKYHGPSVIEMPDGHYEFLKSYNHPSFKKEIEYYNSNPEFQEKYELKSKDENGVPLTYYQYIPKAQAFKQGGQMNVIPEGALHARKNNMELAKEGEVTHKGVPVVDNDGVQQAEVEKEEWTMTKELTEDVEEWYKKYYYEKTSQKEKDELAIKCGKRITKELLHNTDDRANLIAKMLEEEE